MNVVIPRKSRAWRGVDLDGTLAVYEDWIGPQHIGKPIVLMVERVKRWIANDENIRIFTARVHGISRLVEAPGEEPQVHPVYVVIEAWCLEHLDCVLPITCTKDYDMIELWDDRAIQVEFNTGRRMDGKS